MDFKLRAGQEAPTIFVVDDDAVTLAVVSQALRTAGHLVEAYEDATMFLAGEPWHRLGCAVLDLRMPGISGLAVQQAIVDRGGTLPVIILTGSADVKSTISALKSGAVDFLLKPVKPEELLAAVERAVERSARARASRAEKGAAEAKLAQLTPREREVCELLARGMLNKQIAMDLGMSEATVKLHRARVLEKLAVGSTAELSAMLERLRAG
jgi:FixJ family two-component response regulator